VAVVHGRHQRVVEDVDIEVHPESIQAGLGYRSHGRIQRMPGALSSDLGQVDDGDGGAADVLVAEVVVVVKDPVTGQRDGTAIRTGSGAPSRSCRPASRRASGASSSPLGRSPSGDGTSMTSGCTVASVAGARFGQIFPSRPWTITRSGPGRRLSA
jgi:hypothetical protein